jgi:NADP-reducing hydrogenase subunit HndB
MPKLGSAQDLRELRAQWVDKVEQRYAVGTLLVVGMGTCGIQAGARETLMALAAELSKRNLDVQLTHGGCINQCAREPLITVYSADAPPAIYANVTADQVPEFVEKHLVQERGLGGGD